MKRFRSECTYSYKLYSFGYCEYAVVEPHDHLSDVYAEGFLPYSGAVDTPRTCYMARSARVPLKTFTFSSENRRVIAGFDGLFKKIIIPLVDFITDDPAFRTFCLSYFEQRHGANVMPAARFDGILQSGFITHIARYEDAQGNVVAYVFLADDEQISHFWFSFYDLSFAFRSLGMWLMLDCARTAKEKGKAFFYVGTVYGEKALYKTNFNGLEFFDGNEWMADRTRLRSLSRNDAAHQYEHLDRWKETKELF